MSAPPPYPGNEKEMPPPNPAYPQQPPGNAPQYGAQYGQQATTVVVAQPAYTVVQNFRESPVRIKCQFCQADIVTSTNYEIGILTVVACIVLACVGCDLGCCLIPFCMGACKNVVHQCPNCNQEVGRYNRI
ncbi:hypothetical protein DPMN_030010 [Dreissena polymorpha]|uniref:LITAF domain-containing protein n=1 Tax=Dreissena polymorpha TaxID=45954 RepID=A0A9D4LXF2_DREPO|nr:hypothetical protein DPMN_030010 [Dreissena polymorpha]